jgi:ABC-2 type transport system permease protein
MTSLKNITGEPKTSLTLDHPPSSGQLVGTGSLVRLILRRDWMALLAWSLLPAVLVGATATSFASLYPTPHDQQLFAEAVQHNPVSRGLFGPVGGSTLGALVAWRVGVWGALLAAIPSLLLVIRHVRTEEEAGRTELLGGYPVGRLAHLAATLLTAAVGNLVLAASVATSLIANGLPAGGAVALGLSFAGIGWVFVGVAALAAQSASSAQSARGASLFVFTVWLVMRVIGNATSGPAPGCCTRLGVAAWLGASCRPVR